MARPVSVTVLHNPRCSKSRQALALIRERGVEPRVVAYLNEPPSRDELSRLFAKGGIAPRDALRKDAPAVTDDDDALDLMARDPATIERPIVETPRGVVIARPPEQVLDLL